MAHFIAAAGARIGIGLSWRWKLQTRADLDLTPSMHWPEPVLTAGTAVDRGAVLITAEYRIAPQNRDAFLSEIRRLSHERQRDGAYAWDIFEDAADEGRFLETFYVASWLEHLRQHQRVTNADRIIQEKIRQFGGETEPKITHFVAASDGERS